MLTDKEIDKIAYDMGLAIKIDESSVLWFDSDLTNFARAIIEAHERSNKTSKLN